MKMAISILFLFAILAAPALAELTQQDIHQIRLILKEEIEASEKRMKEYIDTSEKRMKEYIDIRFQGVDAQFKSVDAQFKSVNERFESVNNQFQSVSQLSHTTNLTYGLIALIAVAIGIPQILIAFRSSKDKEQERINRELREKIETLERQRIVSS